MTDPMSHLLPTASVELDTTRQFVADQVLSAQAKLSDAQLPGFLAEFNPAEAELAGAFIEDALSEADARASAEDLMPPAPPPVG